jgi:hypothetical protein
MAAPQARVLNTIKYVAIGTYALVSSACGEMRSSIR